MIITLCLKKIGTRARRVVNKWFSSYLKNRTHFDPIGNVSSTDKEILTGIPQGSVLLLLLFSLYLNDLHNSVKYARTYLVGEKKPGIKLTELNC